METCSPALIIEQVTKITSELIDVYLLLLNNEQYGT